MMKLNLPVAMVWLSMSFPFLRVRLSAIFCPDVSDFGSGALGYEKKLAAEFDKGIGVVFGPVNSLEMFDLLILTSRDGPFCVLN